MISDGAKLIELCFYFTEMSCISHEEVMYSLSRAADHP